MPELIINRKYLKRNKQLKLINKESLKKYKKNGKAFLKNKIGKLVDINNVEFISYDYNTSLQINSLDELINLINKEKLCGLSGSGSDLELKLNSINKYPGKKRLLCNAYECDPGLVTDYAIIKNKLDDVASALELLNKLINFDEIVIASKEALTINSKNIKAKVLPDAFPLGYERYLIKEVFGLEYKGLPTDNGVLVLNVQTVLRLFYLACGNSFTSKYITIADMRNGKALVVDVKIDSNPKDVISSYLNIDNCDIYIGGGAFMVDKLQNQLISKETCYIALSDINPFKNDKCIGCGKCSKNCNEHVDCRKAVRSYLRNEPLNKDMFNINNCIGCGLCSFNCPGQIDVRGIVYGTKISKE